MAPVRESPPGLPDPVHLASSAGDRCSAACAKGFDRHWRANKRAWTNAIFIQDLVFWLPSAAIIGWLTWTHRPWGALLAGAYLVYGLVESIGVAVDQWMGSAADPSSEVATIEGTYIFGVLAVIGVGVLVVYARGRSRTEVMPRVAEWSSALPTATRP